IGEAACARSRFPARLRQGSAECLHDSAGRVEWELRMRRRDRTQRRKRVLGVGLAALGVAVWAMSATLRLAPDNRREVSISHFEARSLGVIAGGVSVVGGIILLATAV